MSLPDNVLSTEPVPSPFAGARAKFFNNGIEDYMDGGVALNDTSQGLNYQIWKAEIHHDAGGDEIVLSATAVKPFTIITGTAGKTITEVSLAFNQNMSPVIAFVEDGLAKLYWYDTLISDMTITDFAGMYNPRVALDDIRPTQSAICDVIFAYLKTADKKLYYRQQRDRFQTERKLHDREWDALLRIGMGKHYRFQFQVVDFEDY